MQFIVHFFPPTTNPITKLFLVCWVTQSYCNGNTDIRNSWRQHLGFLQAGITCMKEQQERRSLRLLFYPACCGYRQLCHLGYMLQNSGEPLTFQCTLTCSFIIDWNIRKTGSCQREASSPQPGSKQHYGSILTKWAASASLAVLARPGISETCSILHNQELTALPDECA